MFLMLHMAGRRRPLNCSDRGETGSAVSFAAVLDGGDVEGLAVVMEAQPVVADAQPELGRLDLLKTLYIALATGGKVGQGAQNAQGGRPVDSAELGLGLVPPGDVLAAHVHCPG